MVCVFCIMSATRISIRIDGVKDFTYSELAVATNSFDNSTVVGSGGYGKVHRGVLANGTVVAIKRAQEGSLQGEKEFLTEIELLSRLHHRNLVSLLGYCDEEGEQMLVYEFMPNGTLRDHLSSKFSISVYVCVRVCDDMLIAMVMQASRKCHCRLLGGSRLRWGRPEASFTFIRRPTLQYFIAILRPPTSCSTLRLLQRSLILDCRV